jgi:translation initiation factor 2 alpha subunit (eIF-2alpha)
MYKFKQPELHEIVFVKISPTIKDDNYVSLVDYDNIDGLILCTEITKYVSNIKKITKRDEIFPVIILSKENGYDLSYSKIKNDVRPLLKECYIFQQKIYNLLNKIGSILQINENTITNLIKHNISPSLYDDCINSKKNICKELYDSILVNSHILFDNIDFIIDFSMDDFDKEIKKHLIIHPHIIQKEFKLLIFEENSLRVLKYILNKISNLSDKYNYLLECKSSPIYFYRLTHSNIDDINEKVKELDEQIKNITEEYNCVFELSNDYVVIKKGETIFV